MMFYVLCACSCLSAYYLSGFEWWLVGVGFNLGFAVDDFWRARLEAKSSAEGKP